MVVGIKFSLLRSIPCPRQSIRRTVHTLATMELNDIVSRLDAFAPPKLAESWDNVGLLVEPSKPHDRIEKIMLTNDLTEEVLDEAIQNNSNFILSYHPPIFVPLKRLTQSTSKQRIIVLAIEKRIAIYSPHTSYDCVAGGVNDWLASAFGDAAVVPITTYSQAPRRDRSLSGIVSDKSLQHIETAVPLVSSLKLSECAPLSEPGQMRVTLHCNQSDISASIAALSSCLGESAKTTTWQVQELLNIPVQGYGMGRIVTLTEPITAAVLVERVKSHTGLPYVRLALPEGCAKADDHQVRTIALCAGSGGGVLRGVRADAYLTGELGHHEVLDACCRGIATILCDHSNTERGFLTVLKSKLSQVLENKVDIQLSLKDKDPLTVV